MNLSFFFFFFDIPNYHLRSETKIVSLNFLFSLIHMVQKHYTLFQQKKKKHYTLWFL
jgi:hypothetical protein